MRWEEWANNSSGGRHAEPEHDLQVACVRWFRLQYSKWAFLLFAIPNGGKRNAITAAKLKAEGVVAGVPDLFLAIPCGGYSGLFIEMKNGKKGRLSESQESMIKELRAVGYRVEICRDFECFCSAVGDYLG